MVIEYQYDTMACEAPYDPILTVGNPRYQKPPVPATPYALLALHVKPLPTYTHLTPPLTRTSHLC